MRCARCKGPLRVTNTYTATPTFTTARRVCLDCGAVHVEERILMLKEPRTKGAYARASRAKRSTQDPPET